MKEGEGKEFLTYVLFLILSAVAREVVRLTTTFLEERSRKPSEPPTPLHL